MAFQYKCVTSYLHRGRLYCCCDKHFYGIQPQQTQLNQECWHLLGGQHCKVAKVSIISQHSLEVSTFTWLSFWQTIHTTNEMNTYRHGRKTQTYIIIIILLVHTCVLINLLTVAAANVLPVVVWLCTWLMSVIKRVITYLYANSVTGSLYYYPQPFLTRLPNTTKPRLTWFSVLMHNIWPRNVPLCTTLHV